MKKLFLLLSISFIFTISYGQRYRSENAQPIRSYNEMKVNRMLSGIKVTTNDRIFSLVGVFKITFTDESTLTIKNKESINSKSQFTTYFDLTKKQNSILKTKEIKNWVLIFTYSKVKYKEEKPPSPKFVMNLLN